MIRVKRNIRIVRDRTTRVTFIIKNTRWQHLHLRSESDATSGSPGESLFVVIDADTNVSKATTNSFEARGNETVNDEFPKILDTFQLNFLRFQAWYAAPGRAECHTGKVDAPQDSQGHC